MAITVAEKLTAPTRASLWRYPSLCEINTWIWLSELSLKYGKTSHSLSYPQPSGTLLQLTVSMQCGSWEVGNTVPPESRSLTETKTRSMIFRRALLRMVTGVHHE